MKQIISITEKRIISQLDHLYTTMTSADELSPYGQYSQLYDFVTKEHKIEFADEEKKALWKISKSIRPDASKNEREAIYKSLLIRKHLRDKYEREGLRLDLKDEFDNLLTIKDIE